MILLSTVLKPKCRFCGKHRHPKEFVFPPPVGYCLECHGWHVHALEVLTSGSHPSGCPDCQRSFDQITEVAPNGDVRFALHRKDGVYQFLCGTCSDKYERKRMDQFRGTQHEQQLLAGE